MNDEPDFEELDARAREEEHRRAASRHAAFYDREYWHLTGELVRLPVPEILPASTRNEPRSYP